ncbi:hypothetical protein BDV06DRAFT_230445 [Aspergillus oleicola]
MELLLLLVPVLGATAVSGPWPRCKCTPSNSCWNEIDWAGLNASVKKQCVYVASQWSNTTFQSDEPIGYCYPVDNNCPIVTRTQHGKCDLGSSPVYTINTTKPEDLAVGILFAQENNVRLVIRNTGHDLLGKSLGYGSLQIWIRHLRKGIIYQEVHEPSAGCRGSLWHGAAFTVAGGYVWDEVYEEAFFRDSIVVGGGDPTVGVIGGYIQGSGHSPASQDFGLASDQILEAHVILADGSVVTASPCSYPDLFTALRGGDGGTYGVVVSATIKAYPSKPVVAHSLVIVPTFPSEPGPLLDAITEIYAAVPAFLMRASRDMALAGYQHSLAALKMSLSKSKAALGPFLERLGGYGSLNMSVEWFEFPSYSAYYRALSGVHQPTGVREFALACRMFDKTALASAPVSLPRVIGVLLVGGGKVLEEPQYSGANLAWRRTYLVHEVARAWQRNAEPTIADEIRKDITYHKYGAMRQLITFTGSYLNEADRNNPWWKEDFYGAENYERLLNIKTMYHPDGVFYCPTCVGSPSWHVRKLPGEEYGPLCAA